MVRQESGHNHQGEHAREAQRDELSHSENVLHSHVRDGAKATKTSK